MPGPRVVPEAYFKGPGVSARAEPVCVAAVVINCDIAVRVPIIYHIPKREFLSLTSGFKEGDQPLRGGRSRDPVFRTPEVESQPFGQDVPSFLGEFNPVVALPIDEGFVKKGDLDDSQVLKLPY